MSKEIEKPFRCNVCPLSFTNEDHLQVHKRRHEMSLNLSKGNGGANAEAFADETPTPTRFIRNCEEVGLFQDLQNVNPFDEQFVKAASATPSSEAEFDFSFTFRRGSTQGIEPVAAEGVSTDSLNTPQVFGFQPTTPLISQSHRNVSSQKDSGIGKGEVGHSSQKPSHEQSSVVSARQKHVLDLSLTKFEHDRQSSELTRKTKRLILTTKNKSNLRLNLGQAAEEPKHATSNADNTPEDCLESGTEDGTTEKRAGILERNRAAASRSRERRKRYISALEIKCATLQTKLSHVQADLIATKTENAQLREELSLHSSCSVSLKRLEDVAISSSAIIVTSPIICQSQPHITPRSQDNTVIPASVSLDMSLVTSTITRVKRGRPKRGFEKRVSDLSFLPIAKSSQLEPSTKIQILPISAYKKVISTDANMILLNPGTGS